MAELLKYSSSYFMFESLIHLIRATAEKGNNSIENLKSNIFRPGNEERTIFVQHES